MMDILAELLAAGFSIKLDNNQLVVKPASALTSEQRAFLKANKAQIIKQLLPKRPVVQFKLHNNQGAGICLGDFCDDVQAIIGELKLRYGERLLYAKPQNWEDHSADFSQGGNIGNVGNIEIKFSASKNFL